MDAASRRSGETDSSFEVPSETNSQNYYSKGTPTKSQSGGSLQFVPADHQPVENRFMASPETSWDAVAPNESDRYSNANKAGSVVTPSPPTMRSMRQQRNFRNKSRPQQQRSKGSASVTKLASMFSSRAEPVVVPRRAAIPEPSSPPRSESSTGYVGWPGTQDKQGVTVMAEPSYDEVSAEDRGCVDPSSKHEQDKIHRLQNPVYGENEDTNSDSYSKTSSAYFNAGEEQAIRKGNSKQFFDGGKQDKSRLAAATVMRRCLSSSMSKLQQQQTQLTEERLTMKNRFSAPERNFNNGTAAGYRGLLDKTRDVPNLIDDTSSDCTSAITTATNDMEQASNYKQQMQKQREQQHVNTIDEEDRNEGFHEHVLGATSRTNMEKMSLALLGGGLTTIQTTTGDFNNRKTASDFDENLSNSDCDQYGFAKIPAFHEMVNAGTRQRDQSFTSQSLRFHSEDSNEHAFRPRIKDKSSNFDFMTGSYRATDPYHDFSQYYIPPEVMQVLVKKFRKMSAERSQYFDFEEDLEREEDATKAFALSEMRSRIMEKDIERGLERRGGTTTVDDIVLTDYHKAAMRVRDTVIVAKAWHDGATPQDVVNTANLTRRDEHTYFIPRMDTSAKRSGEYTWEEVNWLDDNALTQYRCHSLGPRHLKGTEMFTIGDCQSILLKLSNERCQELRFELNEATATQIEAEGIMKEEGETFDGMMTEAEMTYLSSMEDVKSISQKLVLAEKSFALVKDRIEKLVAKYEALLVHFENDESVAPSSVFSYESSYVSDYSFAAAKQREDATLARRAQRAELKAELNARESLLSKQGRSAMRKEKEKELNNLRARIADLQSEASTAFTDKDRSVALARALTRSNQANRSTSGGDNGEAEGRSSSRSKINDIKQRFRNRSAAKVHFQSDISPAKQSPVTNQQAAERFTNNVQNSFHRTVGEEMFQHLDFYERSLKAVERPR